LFRDLHKEQEESSMSAKRAFLVGVIGVLGALGCFGQNNATFYPTGAHVNLYFPHLADGGPGSGQWQTALEFVNPSLTMTANVQVNLYGDQGFPLSLDFGAGSLTIHTFTIAPGGTFTLRSTIGTSLVTGRAVATSDIPIQGTVLFRFIAFGSTQIEVSAPPTLPTARYISLATKDLGIAIANIDTVAKSYQVTAVNSSGTNLASTIVGVAGLGHYSFNLVQVLPGLGASFTGSVIITPQLPGDQVLAWTLASETGVNTTLQTGVLATLPSGPLEWPISHPDRIQLVYKRLLAVAPSLLASLGNNLSLATAPNLVIAPDIVVNASASSSNQSVTINLALSELVSDSPSELAFLVGHELGHIAQFRSGTSTVLLPNDPASKEADADLIAMVLVLKAGFDPYGAAGAIGKLSVANGSSGLVSPFFDNLSDPTVAFNAARMNSLLGTITSACTNYATLSGFCGPFKATIHPHFPGSAPL
jgi:hypothetical protein